MKQLKNTPPKGTADWDPKEFAIRKYIFDTWRSVCEQFGYKEYLTPQIEDAAVYRAKSGEDLGGKELWTLTDQAGREFAIRPEMTPSVTRMVSKTYQSEPKPIRLFSIANFMRNEKPQKGRNREFWQLNFDIFGTDSLSADIEILQMALEIILAFNPPKDSFTLFINNRKLIDAALNDVAAVTEEQRVEVVRILDKWEKLSPEEFSERLRDSGLQNEQIEKLQLFMQSNSGEELLEKLPELQGSEGLKEVNQMINQLKQLGYAEWITFNPSVIRGFDYYDGMVFEVFDKNPENNRSMFGGGRYNGLASLFGSESFPAVGCAPGDETTRIFLEDWNLIPENLQPERYYLPIIDANLSSEVQSLAQQLRKEGKNIELGLEEERVGKAFSYADKSGATFIILFGENEKSSGVYKVKNLLTGEEKEVSF